MTQVVAGPVEVAVLDCDKEQLNQLTGSVDVGGLQEPLAVATPYPGRRPFQQLTDSDRMVGSAVPKHPYGPVRDCISGLQHLNPGADIVEHGEPRRIAA